MGEGNRHGKHIGKGNLLTIWIAEMSTTTRKQGECTTQRLPMQLLREEQCVVRSEMHVL